MQLSIFFGFRVIAFTTVTETDKKMSSTFFHAYRGDTHLKIENNVLGKVELGIILRFMKVSTASMQLKEKIINDEGRNETNVKT